MVRGEWGGDSEERGFTGSTIKDTWPKPRGSVEAGERGGFRWGGVEEWEKSHTTVIE